VGELQLLPIGTLGSCKDVVKTKDNTVNCKGRKFIDFCDDNNNLVALNGRTYGTK
jgi:hypothetical protein